MTRITCFQTISVDGFTAGPSQSLGDPLGVGGQLLHRWMFADHMHPADAAVRDEIQKDRGAYVMGRNMFGPVRGDWDRDWRGWWGDEPPYHAPVFVLTHHARDPIEMRGGTTFHFVSEGLESALRQAKEVAGEREILIAGGASTVRQALAAGAIAELTLSVAPILLGAGERLFDGVADPGLEPIQVVQSPLATHVRYRVGGPPTS